MDANLQEFPEHAAGVAYGLLQAVLTDPDMLVLATAGVIGGRRTLAKALMLYVTFRRVDQYMKVYDRNSRALRRLIDTSALSTL